MVQALNQAVVRAYSRVPQSETPNEAHIAEYEFAEMAKILRDPGGPFAGKVRLGCHRR